LKRKYPVKSAFLIVSCVYIYLALGYAGGITGRTKKSGSDSGCTCHGSASNSVNVNITGPDTVFKNATVNYVLTISGGPLIRGGTDIAVSLGRLIIVNGSGLREIDGELTHVFPKSPEQGLVSFSFLYKAPAYVSIDTIFANGNSVNFDLLPYNDKWNFAANKKIIVSDPIGIIYETRTVNEYSLEQNYPNPFNPVTKFSFSIQKQGIARVCVFDMLGSEVDILLDAPVKPGLYYAEWNGEKYSSGVYYYRLTVINGNSQPEYSRTRRMVLLK
jgi:hypothetical protein